MSSIDKQTLEEYSDKLNFNRDTLEKVYRLELLFDDDAVLSNIKNHPMALWKMKEYNKNQEIKDNQSAGISD